MARKPSRTSISPHHNMFHKNIISNYPHLLTLGLAGMETNPPSQTAKAKLNYLPCQPPFQLRVMGPNPESRVNCGKLRLPPSNNKMHDRYSATH